MSERERMRALAETVRMRAIAARLDTAEVMQLADAFLALLRSEPVGQSWLPTAENINALPMPLRDYIHRIETRCDPAGEVRELVIAKDTIRALEAERDAEPVGEPECGPSFFICPECWEPLCAECKESVLRFRRWKSGHGMPPVSAEEESDEDYIQEWFEEER